ncbi:Rieske (2Fe-2S) protein [Aldersonia kunmingensis]|uniref:Rieske (2Fe-2S) protein n=1 Tax=Aldersonia kunmingensis TaxID=408066 RepID=UPI00083639EB|nr:Rieske (2Fe-2S) protein [Aldersonia kunmingensis]
MSADDLMINRRTAVAGAGVAAVAVAIAACSSSDDSSDTSTKSEPAPAGQSGNIVGKTSEVPVGGGAILGGVVVTQPSAGTFLAFSPVCPHKGCNVDGVAGGTINCPCHGSKFNLNGGVVTGPATTGLAPRSVTVDGDSLVVT